MRFLNVALACPTLSNFWQQDVAIERLMCDYTVRPAHYIEDEKLFSSGILRHARYTLFWTACSWIALNCPLGRRQTCNTSLSRSQNKHLLCALKLFASWRSLHELKYPSVLTITNKTTSKVWGSGRKPSVAKKSYRSDAGTICRHFL